jgi:threonine dehydrogenase-like Zn-dependent dehydrogenase
MSAACQNKFNVAFHMADVPPHFRGTYGEYVYIPPATPIFKVPESLSDEVVAAANCALSQVIYGISSVPPKMGDTVVVQGAGGLGVYAVAVAKELGAGQVIVIDQCPERLQLAREFGADVCLDFEKLGGSRRLINEVRGLTGGRGADVVIGVAGVPSAVGDGVRMLAAGRTMLEMGNIRVRRTVEIDPAYMVLRGLSLKTVLSYEPWALGAAVSFLERNRDRLPLQKGFGADRFPFERVNEAFEKADRGEVFRASLVFGG